jgi:hypothetical protein
MSGLAWVLTDLDCVAVPADERGLEPWKSLTSLCVTRRSAKKFKGCQCADWTVCTSTVPPSQLGRGAVSGTSKLGIRGKAREVCRRDGCDRTAQGGRRDATERAENSQSRQRPHPEQKTACIRDPALVW